METGWLRGQRHGVHAGGSHASGDHRKTRSWGSSLDAKKWRLARAQQIASGDLSGAFEMEATDITGLYNQGLLQ